jgi:ankyrin repeat protein
MADYDLFLEQVAQSLIKGDSDVLELALENGLDPDVDLSRDRLRMTYMRMEDAELKNRTFIPRKLLEIATANGNLNNVDLLLRYGATPTEGTANTAIRTTNIDIIYRLFINGMVITKNMFVVAMDTGSIDMLAKLNELAPNIWELPPDKYILRSVLEYYYVVTRGSVPDYYEVVDRLESMIVSGKYDPQIRHMMNFVRFPVSEVFSYLCENPTVLVEHFQGPFSRSLSRENFMIYLCICCRNHIEPDISNSDLDSVKHLLVQRFDDYDYLLIEAIKNENTKILDAILNIGGVDLDVVSLDNKTPMMIAVEKGDIPLIGRLQDRGLTDFEVNGETGLKIAIENKNYDCIYALLQGVVDTNNINLSDIPDDKIRNMIIDYEI